MSPQKPPNTAASSMKPPNTAATALQNFNTTNLLPHKRGPQRETYSLCELFDRNARTEGVWGKEPPEYKRDFVSAGAANPEVEAGMNCLCHKLCEEMKVYYGYADFVRRTDQRYPESRDNVCVYFWTSYETACKMTRIGSERTWKTLAFQYCNVHTVESESKSSAFGNTNKGTNGLNGTSTSQKPSTARSSQTASSTGVSDTNLGPSASQNGGSGSGTNSGQGKSGGGTGSGGSGSGTGGGTSSSSTAGSSGSSSLRKKKLRYFLGEFTTKEPDFFVQRALRTKVIPFSEEGYESKPVHPGKVHLVECLTGLTFREVLRGARGGLKQFQICVPFYIPIEMIVPSMSYASAIPPDPSSGQETSDTQLYATHSQRQWPEICNIDIGQFDAVVDRYWCDLLIESAMYGDPNKMRLCLEKGESSIYPLTMTCGITNIVNYKDPRGWTALHCVANILHDKAFLANNRKKECLDLLLEKKADIHSRTFKGEKPFMLAESKGFDMCADLLRRPPPVRLDEYKEVRDKGKTSLETAIREKIIF